MTPNGFPPLKQGLYDPQFEHDACGIGFIASIKGKASHEIVLQSLLSLKNLSHRGGSGAEENTGDGAGILTQIPHYFFKNVCSEMHIDLPASGNYGVGMLFLPRETSLREKCEKSFEEIVRSENQIFLGWRNVPFNDSSLGQGAKSCMPRIKQVFIGRNPEIKSDLDFERVLYIIRRLAEKKIRYSGDVNLKSFYIASLSCKTIVYKGMLTPKQVSGFFTDLSHPDYESALALFHSRYSTNTFPSWERAHPNRYLIHNGEINTIRGNVNWMYARQSTLKSKLFGDDVRKVLPVINQDGSDSAMFDNCLEFLLLSGRSLPHSIMMMIPEPWSNHESMSDEKKAFYEYHSCLMEPWDGPAAMAFTDGTVIGAVLDRNGLRPARYYVTTDGLVVMASEVGVLDFPADKILYKERLRPGRMLLIDTKKGCIINDDEIKSSIAAEQPYQEWLNKYLVHLSDLPEAKIVSTTKHDDILLRQKAFGFTYEELIKIIIPMARDGVESLGSMGTDSPLAVLSDKPQLLYNYFKQLFAQVTNPPIDAAREGIVTATDTLMGSEGALIDSIPEGCRQLKIKTPIISNDELVKIKQIDMDGFNPIVLPITFKISEDGDGLENAMNLLCHNASIAVDEGANILILTDRNIDNNNAAIPALLAVAGLHHHLIRECTRTRVAIVLESGEPREIHHFALLLGYGASAINPYLTFETIDNMILTGELSDITFQNGVKNYIKAATKGVIKVLSKMGISTIQSYQGAQIFEALGINQEVIDKYFTWTPSRIGGIGIDLIAAEVEARHHSAYSSKISGSACLESGGQFQWRKDGEYHLYNPESIYKLQHACRTNDFKLFMEYSELINNQTQRLCTLRGLMEFKYIQTPIPINEVESVESICKRFKTGAMSFGSISKEAHETLAIAMNRIYGKSNSGEGGEDPRRFILNAKGDSCCSAIKQVASGRFGVTSEYLLNAKEIQIKMAQGAKPGEGGQLPGRKVYPWIAQVRHSTPGVGLISPPPHHDIYSIEDLAELIFDLRNVNQDARISVKLVSEVGVGTVAAGVAKGRADVILISGYDGGTGASPRTSIKHTGLPWELGLAESHQTLMLNNLRSRVTLEADGKLMTGRDVAIAALLGAEEFGFATAPLVVLGCVMMRVCNLDTCPVGIATQNPDLRSKFCGDPQHVVNFMYFIAQELREIMAGLGVRSVEEMVGRTDLLETSNVIQHSKVKDIDLSSIFFQPKVPFGLSGFLKPRQDYGLDKTMDNQILLNICKPALNKQEAVNAILPIKNTNRAVGTMLGSEVTKKYGLTGLPEDTITLNFFGSAGQSFGAFIPQGVTLRLEGDTNDYLGKGLSGGKIIVFPPKRSTFKAEDNIITGNVAFYGATGGKAYICGAAGERFCVRNSGLRAIVESIGDHGCEYMTGGRVIVLGSIGRNFAAGMSGGIAYVIDWDNDFKNKCNLDMVFLEKIVEENEMNEVKDMISSHMKHTNSKLARRVIEDWDQVFPLFIKVMPKDYKRMLNAIKEVKISGISSNDALMAAFELNNKDKSRISGN